MVLKCQTKTAFAGYSGPYVLVGHSFIQSFTTSEKLFIRGPVSFKIAWNCC